MEPWGKRRIEGDIKRIRREVNALGREKRGEIKSKRKVKELENKYNIKRKRVTLIIEELKQMLLTKSAGEEGGGGVGWKRNTIGQWTG